MANQHTSVLTKTVDGLTISLDLAKVGLSADEQAQVLSAAQESDRTIDLSSVGDAVKAKIQNWARTARFGAEAEEFPIVSFDIKIISHGK